MFWYMQNLTLAVFLIAELELQEERMQSLLYKLNHDYRPHRD